MTVFLLSMIAIVITGGGFAGSTYYGMPIFYLILMTLLASYGYYFVQKRETLSMGPAEKCLIVFEGWGLLYVLFSFTGVNQIFQTDLVYDSSFIPRQAVYLFVLPAAILLREDTWMRGVKRFLKKYGELVFWVLYFAQMLFFHQVIVTVTSVAFLGWLSLQLDTHQRWRRWIRILALMVTPMFIDGQSTILILRMVFLAVCIVPKKWLRIALCVMAAGVFLVVAVCFIMPVTIGDNVFSDENMSWRMRIWKEEETNLADTYFLGTGYGTSYPSKTYLSGVRDRREYQYMEGDGYTAYERPFVTAPHNSFISLTMRTGFIGLLLFLLYLFQLFWNIVKYKTPPSRAACFALFAGIVIILFNVGLESPVYLVTFVFFTGICAREGKKQKDQNESICHHCCLQEREGAEGQPRFAASV